MYKTIIVVALFLATYSRAQQVGSFSLVDINNKTTSINELKGSKVTILDFWASWCKPCLKSMPELNKIYELYKNKGVQVIGINTDGPRSTSKVAPLTKSLAITYPVLLDINSTLMTELNVQALPTLILLDKSGKVSWIHQGFDTGDVELIKAEIEKRIN